MIAIIDYGMGNVGSVLNMLRKAGGKGVVSDDPAVIYSSSKLILPGVGSFDHGMKSLAARGLIPTLQEAVVRRHTPILGICLGAQLFARSSEEGSLPGLGWIEAANKKFRFEESSNRRKVPHMGWNVIHPKRDHHLLRSFNEEPRFYFVHSYHIVCDNPEDVLATSLYGIEFTAVVRKGNIMGTQFHPEKSHRFGMQVIKNFVEM